MPHRSSSFRHRLRAAAALGAALLGGATQAADLTVDVLGARSAQGSVAGALYAGATGWMQPAQARHGQFVPAADKVQLQFRNLVPGRYALSVYHDENGNARLDANPAGMPLERYGFSRDAQGHMGPPGFDEAAVDLQADTHITIQLH